VIQSLKERIDSAPWPRSRRSITRISAARRAGVAIVSGQAGQVDERMQVVRNLVYGTPGAELLDWQETQA